MPGTFDERRPFFVEGAGYFGLGGLNCFFCSNVSNLSMLNTRRIGIGVEDDFEIIGVHVRVAADEARADAPRPGIVEHARANVQRRAVEREPHLGALGRELPFVRLVLTKIGRWRSRMPDRLIESPIKVNCFMERDRARIRRRRGVDALRY